MPRVNVCVRCLDGVDYTYQAIYGCSRKGICETCEDDRCCIYQVISPPKKEYTEGLCQWCKENKDEKG